MGLLGIKLKRSEKSEELSQSVTLCATYWHLPQASLEPSTAGRAVLGSRARVALCIGKMPSGGDWSLVGHGYDCLAACTG